MAFQSIVGQEHVKKILLNSLHSNKLSHAYIFSGPSGTGRKKMALSLAQAIYCTNKSEDACGHCVECRKVEHGNHPDLHWVEPEGTSIKIEQIREIQKKLAQRSMSNVKQIYIVSKADLMTIQAANSLLKFLEEPAGSVLAILVTENGHALLPTIRSRAQWLSFLPLSPHDLLQRLGLEGYSGDLARAAVHLTSGIEAAKGMIISEWFAETRNVVIQLARESLTRYTSAIITLHQKVKLQEVNDHLDTFLDLWVLWFQDMIQISLGNKQALVYMDQQEWFSQHAFLKNIQHWIQCMEYIVETRKRLRYHVNPQLALEHLIIQIQGG
ncbi:MAG: DNA polymerase III subunit delta' [Paenibacillus sp. RIFOXYA1_FULL_44_5]|nr:MAG: DNA polymerase III subunit delta' [Paenibacillus sp. RIFOXYA1_FULL_44_5]